MFFPLLGVIGMPMHGFFKTNNTSVSESIYEPLIGTS